MTKKSWIIIIAEAILFIFLMGSFVTCSNNKVDLLKHNINSYKDSIEYVTLQNGQLLATQESLILSEAEARKELEITKNELKNLKDKLNEDIAYIAKLETQINIKDTLWMKPDTVFVQNDGTYVKTFDWFDKWTKLNAAVYGNNINDSKLTLNSLSIDVPLELGLSDDYEFWVTSENPYVTFTDINSVVINNSIVKRREKRFHHGVYAGFGFHYGLFGKSWDFGPQIGYGIEYSF